MEFINEGLGPKEIIEGFHDLEEPRNGMQHSNDISPNAFDIQKALQKALIDPNEENEVLPMILSIGQVAVCTMGNLSVILGKPKARKSGLAILFLVGLLNGNLSPMSGYLFKGKKRIIWFDTEMSRPHAKKGYLKVRDMATNSEYYTLRKYSIRKHTDVERRQMIHQVLVEENQENDIAFCVIDGIRDLLLSINDEKAAPEIANWLMHITEEKGFHLLTVIHENKHDTSATGHLGSAISAKAETVFRSERRVGKSKVTPHLCRNEEFIPFTFTYDEVSGFPKILEIGDNYTDTNNDPRKAINAETISGTKHKEIMESIYEVQSEYSRGDLESQVQLRYREEGFSMGMNKVKQVISYCINLKLIEKDGNAGSKGKYIKSQGLIPPV